MSQKYCFSQKSVNILCDFGNCIFLCSVLDSSIQEQNVECSGQGVSHYVHDNHQIARPKLDFITTRSKFKVHEFFLVYESEFLITASLWFRLPRDLSTSQYMALYAFPAGEISKVEMWASDHEVQDRSLQRKINDNCSVSNTWSRKKAMMYEQTTP